MKILNFGSLNIDHVYRLDRFVRPGETRPCLEYSKGCGGKGLNQSVALAQAGAEVYHAGVLGSDGEFLRQKLEEKGVDCRYLQRENSPCGHAIIQVEASGQNCILLYPGTNFLLTKALVDRVLSQFSAGDILLLQNETNLLPYLMEQAAARRIRVAFNAAPITQAVLSYPLEAVTWLLVNETEGAGLTGQTEPERIAAAIGEKYPNLELVLTLGTDGCIYCKDRSLLHVPAKKVQAVDTTAAGDTFTGYFLSAVAAGETAEYALRLATAASAIAVTRPGAADSVPARSQVIL